MSRRPIESRTAPLATIAINAHGLNDYFRFLESVSRLVCLSLGDAEKLQKLRQLQNLDAQAAEIMKFFDLAKT